MKNELNNLDELNMNLKHWEEQSNQNVKAREREEENAKKEIREKYEKIQEPIYKEIGNARTKIRNHCKEMELYSTFDSKIIGDVLEELVTTFEGEKYHYQESTFETTKMEHYDFDRDEVKIIKEVRIIIKDSCKGEKYDKFFNKLYDYLYEGNAMILCEVEYNLEPTISFNYANYNNDDIDTNVKYGRFYYVKDFINSVIDFKMINKITDLSKADLNKLLSEFLGKRKDIIEANYHLRIKEVQEQSNHQLEEKQKQYSFKLKKL